MVCENWRLRLLHAAEEALFPRRCPVCDAPVRPEDGGICPACRELLPLIGEPTCRICGRRLAGAEEELCHNCLRHRFSFERGIVLMDYTDLTARSLAGIKYRGKKEYLDVYAREAALRYGEEIRRLAPDALVPVPVHPGRRRRRGYNQAEVLAEKLGALLDIPVCPQALRREKNTLALKSQGAGERLKSLMTAFSPGMIPEDLQCALLVDDIFTTGATMESCTRVLLQAGVKRVFCFSLAIRPER